MIDENQKAELDAHYKACEQAAFEASVEYQATQPLRDEITALKAKIALLEAKINTTKKIIKHCQPVEPSYANEEWIDALTAINKCLQ